MTNQYTAEQLVNRFKKVGNIRKRNKNFANDAGYWEGGRCNWGGSHNLQEDCQTFANAFNKIDSLGEIKKELLACASKGEFDSKKQNFLRKVQEAESGLQVQTGSSSYIFGVCCIWGDEASDKHVKRITDEVKKEIEKVKNSLNKTDYKWTEEIKQLDLEIGKLEAEIQKQRKEAMEEKDPIRRGKILQVIEENGKKLEEKYRKKQELSNKFNFDPGKKVGNLIDAIKRAIDKKDKNGSRSSGSSRGNKNPDNSDSEDSSGNESSDSDDKNTNNKPRKNKLQPLNFFQTNQTLILISGVALLIFFYLYSSQETPKSPHYPDYDF